MKYLMITLVCLGLTGCVTADRDVLSGNWSFRDSLNQNLKPWGYKIVEKSDGHPVRSGEKSIRFEVRSGDCSWSSGKSGLFYSDCDRHAERRERKHFPPPEGGGWKRKGGKLVSLFNILAR